MRMTSSMEVQLRVRIVMLAGGGAVPPSHHHAATGALRKGGQAAGLPYTQVVGADLATCGLCQRPVGGGAFDDPGQIRQRVRNQVGARSSSVLNRMTALELCLMGNTALEGMEQPVSRVLGQTAPT